MTMLGSKTVVIIAWMTLGLAAASARPAQPPDAGRAKVPITTASDEARALYLKARDLVEKLRPTDSHKLFEAAVAKDPSFALGYLGLATTAPTTKDFFAALDRAVALADRASDPERLMIHGLHAGATGDPGRQREHYLRLAGAYPRDERALTLLGGFYFGQQDYPKAIETYNRAVAINPAFSQPYNLLGYAYRFVERYRDAEQAFKKYIELIPGDPNPYDSYAELLMKTGRFDESIKSYDKALAIDANFISAYVGIANDHMFSGRGDAARAVLARMTRAARNDGERNQALAWTAVSFIHEAAWDQALAQIDQMVALAERAKDLGQQANDLNFKANTLLEAGRPDAAGAAFQAQVETSERANLPAEVKEATRRNTLFDQARVALAKHDLATARARAVTYGELVAARKIPFELRQHHELAGLIALAEARPKVAAAELTQANQQDPRVLYLLAVALSGTGDAGKARAAAKKAAEFNGLSFNYGYVRGKARRLLDPAKPDRAAP